MNQLLSKHRKEPKPKTPPAITIHSPPGVGKTTLATQFKNSCIICTPQEAGIEDLISCGRVSSDYPYYMVNNWEELQEVIRGLATEDHGHKFVFADTASVIERLMYEHVLRVNYDGNKEKFDAWGKQGYSFVLDLWKEFLRDFFGLRNLASPIMPVLLCHSVTKVISDPTREPYDQRVPKVYHPPSGTNSLLTDTIQESSEVWMMDFAADTVVSAEDRVGAKVARATSNGERLLYTKHRPFVEAKSKIFEEDQWRVPLGNTPKSAYNTIYNALFPKTKKD